VSRALLFYYRATRAGAKFATITGKGFRPARIDLGRWKYPCALWVLLIPISLAAPLVIMLWASFLPIYTSPSLAAFGALATCVVAWMVGRRREPSRWGIDVLASLPLVFPGIVLGIAILVQFL